MKYKTNKLKKLEQGRMSILTEDLKTCYICKKNKQDLHEIFEGARRVSSIKYNMVVPLCRYCHNKIHTDRELSLHFKRLCQKEFEKENSREKFIEIFKRSYL